MFVVNTEQYHLFNEDPLILNAITSDFHVKEQGV